MSDAITAAQTPGWAAPAKPSAWFVMHKPLWAADDYPNPPEQADYRTGNVLRAAMSATGNTACKSYDASSCGLKAVLAAHLHILQNMVTAKSALPQQYVVGNSGVRMDHGVAPAGCLLTLDPLGFGTTSQTGVVLDLRARNSPIDNRAFGFAHFARDTSAGQPGWMANAYFVGNTTPTPLGTAKGLDLSGRKPCLHQ